MSAHARGTVVAAVALLAVLAGPVHAQHGPTSSSWMAFVGCWEPLGAEDDTGLLCFRPSGDGVEMSNYYEGEVTGTECHTQCADIGHLELTGN